ncbi:DUF302 domain-containing protein [Streptacidiphilus sp. NEAU-YB345]|uniref:DUF302 domain-containing protein n=1 Tax=Streptacidiphilus fuscans TaxID=2789292 RepID=A0A931BHU7_9ACTN|nr:DUF302 domain-containing protein [Streptacidiphilus fuscans]
MSIRSPFGVPETVDRIRRALEAKGLDLFALVDHSGAAHEAGLAMNDTKLLVFGNPKAGTPAMVAAPLLAIELPLKALVWTDDAGVVRVGYQDPAELQRRYQVPDEVMGPLSHVGELLAAALAS